jgi:ParB family transcriptional regulator, chromosome partitioning protein
VYPHSHGLRRTSAEDQAALDAAQAEFTSLTEQHAHAEELPDDVDARFTYPAPSHIRAPVE